MAYPNRELQLELIFLTWIDIFSIDLHNISAL